MLKPNTIITHPDQKTENQLPQVHINHLVVADYHQNLVPNILPSNVTTKEVHLIIFNVEVSFWIRELSIDVVD